MVRAPAREGIGFTYRHARFESLTDYQLEVLAKWERGSLQNCVTIRFDPGAPFHAGIAQW